MIRLVVHRRNPIAGALISDRLQFIAIQCELPGNLLASFLSFEGANWDHPELSIRSLNKILLGVMIVEHRVSEFRKLKKKEAQITQLSSRTSLGVARF